MLGAFLVPVLLGGCVSASPSGGQGVSGSDAASSFGAVTVREPFESLMLTVDESAKEVNDASELAVARCMKDRGFDYKPLPYHPRRVEAPRFGDVEFAQKEGFNLDEPGSSDQQVGAAEQSTAWVEALLGKIDRSESDANVIRVELPDGSVTSSHGDSCASIGLAAVYGDMQEWDQVRLMLEYMAGEVSNRIMADPQYVAANGKVRSCVAEKGYSEKDVEAVFETSSSKKQSPAEKQREIDIAVAYAECEVQADVASIYAKLLVKYETEVANENQGTIIKFAEIQKQAAVQAKNVLASK